MKNQLRELLSSGVRSLSERSREVVSFIHIDRDGGRCGCCTCVRETQQKGAPAAAVHPEFARDRFHKATVGIGERKATDRYTNAFGS